MTYLAIYVLIAALAYAAPPSRRAPAYAAVMAISFLVTAFRFEVGCDWGNYLRHYRLVAREPIDFALTQSDPLWWLLIDSIEALGLPYPWVNVAVTILFFAGAHTLAKKSANPAGFIALLFPVLVINMTMSGLRQAIAIGLLMIAFSTFLDRKPLRFIIWTAIAAGFHSSAAGFFLLAPLVGGQITVQRLIVAGLIALPGFAILVNSGAADTAFERYVSTGRDAGGAVFRGGILVLTSGLFFILLNRRWRRLAAHEHTLVFAGAGMMVLLIAIIPLSTVISDRLGYYLVPIQALILLKAPDIAPASLRFPLRVAPYAGLGLVLLVWTALSSHYQWCYDPYQSWMFGFPAGAIIS